MAEVNVLSVEGLTKSFGERVLFEDLTFGVALGKKVALIARNGSGKSTLLKIITGIESPDSGNIVFRTGFQVGYLDQDSDFDPEITVLDAMMNTDHPAVKAIKEYELAMLDEDATRINEAMHELDELQAWDIESRIHEIAGRLKLDDLQQQVKILSGGQKRRLALAQLLVMEPDLMILDEPTNHLDLEMIEWLEQYLDKKNNTIIMVTHDRYFLEVVCDEILELDQKTLFTYKGNYSYYLEKKADREEVEKTTLEKKKSFLRNEVDWIRRQPKARGTKSKSRTDKFYEVKGELPRGKERDLEHPKVKIERIGTKLIEFHNISKGFDGKTLFSKFDYNFQRNEKVGLIGPNGSGKSTLIKLILNELKPDTGKIVIGETMKIGHFSQDGLDLREDKRIIEVVRDIAEYIQLEKGHKLTAAQLLERFLFDRKVQWQYVSTLSGGEKKRLQLLTVLMRNPNFLILDEPTNDLDVYTLTILEDYLMHFQGGLLVVSHDRYFMDKLIDHLFVFTGEEDEEIIDFPGNYTQFREKEKELKKGSSAKVQAPEKKVIVEKKPSGKITYAERIELEGLEGILENLETKKDSLAVTLSSCGDDHEKLMEVSKEMEELMKEIDAKTERWIELSDKEN
jgi:ATP-binding cassette subfamily F protein uup